MFANRLVHIVAPVLALMLAVAPSTAFAADEVGTAGIATSIDIVSPSSDTYLIYNGRVFVGTDEYRWGGTSCGSRTLSAENVRSLTQAVRSGMTVTPRYQIGQGTTRCLVGYTLERLGARVGKHDDDDRGHGHGHGHGGHGHGHVHD
jgi:hypothetical protein